jgi:hypothetical protein
MFNSLGSVDPFVPSTVATSNGKHILFTDTREKKLFIFLF